MVAIVCLLQAIFLQWSPANGNHSNSPQPSFLPFFFVQEFKRRQHSIMHALKQHYSGHALLKEFTL